MIDPRMAELGAILESWVVFSSPADYPGRWVVRRQWAMKNGQVLTEYRPTAVEFTLEDARAHIPEYLCLLQRQPDDAPQIHEVWI
jgi:hypothetical protein